MGGETGKTTTLAVPKAFADKLREQHDGYNDLQRLKNWKKTQETYNNSITLEEIKSAVEDALQENLNSQALEEY